MPIPSVLTDGKNTVQITDQRVLVVGNSSFSDPIQHDMDSINTAFNFFEPISGKILIITDVIINCARSVGVNGSIIEIYGANSAIETTVVNKVLRFDLAKQATLPLTGLNIKLPEGKWLNGKCDDATVLLTIGGYYAPVV